MQRSIPKLSKITRRLCKQVMLLLFLVSGAAFAFPVRQVYVSQTGVDAPNRGDVNAPFRSINYAVMNPPTNLGNGDTLIVNVLAGFYNDNVNIPDGWPSMQLSCSVAPGRTKLIIKGPNALYINGRLQGVSPITNMAGRVVNQEAIIQQASAGQPAFRIGEGTDVEIWGLTINNANHQAVAFDAGAKKPYLCQNFAAQFAPQLNCIPASIKLRYNIFQTSGSQTGNAGGDFDPDNGNFDRRLGGEGIVGIKNNKGVNPVNGKRATFVFQDNIVRNVAGYANPNDPTDDPLGFRRVGVFVQNSEDTVSIMNNRFEGNSQTLFPSGTRPMSNAVLLFGVRGTKDLNIMVSKNRIEDTDQSGIRILSADTLEACTGGPACFGNQLLGLPVNLTNRWISTTFNSISKTNAAKSQNFGGIELTFVSPKPGTPDPDGDVTCRNEWLFQNDNFFDACNINAIVYNGNRTYRKRSFFANRNIFNKTVSGGAPGRGVFNNFQDINLVNPDDVTVVEAAGNWWGDNRGADHKTVQGNFPNYNIATGNQIASNGFNSDVGVYYSPWLAGYGTNGSTSPDDMMDNRDNPSTWGFQDVQPKTWIAKELLNNDDLALFAPDDQRTPPGYHIVAPDMVPTRDLSDILRDLAVTGYVSRGVSLAKSNDTINVLKGTYAETVTINKDLYIYGAQRGMSAACNSLRRISDDNPYNDKSLPLNNLQQYPNDPLRNESKITALRFTTDDPQGSVVPFYINSDVKVTLDGLAVYSGTSSAIVKDDAITTTKDIRLQNLIVTTIDRPDVANTSPGRTNNGFEGGAIVDLSRHTGKLWINDNRFENLCGRFSFNVFSPSITAVLLEGVNGSTWITRNYFQGNIEELQYDLVNGQPTEQRVPLGNAITLISTRPTGTDSMNIERNYIFRPDFSGISVIDTANMGYVNNVNIRWNTIDQANVGAFYIGKLRVLGLNLNVSETQPNTQEGGVTMRFGNSMTNNIAVQFNNIKNTRFASVNLKQQNNTNFAVPSNFRVVYNIFDTRNGETVSINTVDNLAPSLPNITYTFDGTLAGFTAFKEMGMNVTWTGAGNVNARGNWWGTIEGPIHDFNVNGDGLGINPRSSLKVHYSPWVAASTTPDDGFDLGPIWDSQFVNNNAPSEGPFIDRNRNSRKSNYQMDCSTWGYQDRLQKTYSIEISSPGLSECQPQVAINMMKDGDVLNINDVTSFAQEDLVINKNIVIDAPGVNVSAKMRDIIVLNGKKVTMRQNITARSIYLACNVNVAANSCQNLYTAYPGMGNLTGPLLANGYIETWSNPRFIKYLDFTGTVCEEPDMAQVAPDRYVRGYLRTKRRVRAGQGETFGNMGFEVTAGVDNLDSVTVNRMAGPDTFQLQSNPTFDHIVTNGDTSINRSWAIKTKNPYNTGDRRVIVNWYKKEDNDINLLYARPWNKNSTLTNGQWYGLQPSTLSPDVNPRRVVIDGLEKWRLMDTLTIAENVCNIMASISKPMPSLICEQGTINFNIMIKGGQPPYWVTVRENNLTPVQLGPFNGMPDGNGMYTFPVTFNTQGPGPLNFYTITEVKDQTGCRELVNLGSAQTIDVRPVPTARLVGDPQPVCNGNPVQMVVDFSAGTGPWRVGYRIGNDPTVNYVTTTQDPFNLSVVPTNNSTQNDIQVPISLVSVDYGPGTCNGAIVDAPSRNVTVRSAPTVTFGGIASNSAIKACQCSSPTVDVILEGKGPWQLQYSIRAKDGMAPPTMGVVTLGNAFDPALVTRTFEVNPNIINPFVCPADTFYMKLDRVIDANGCATIPATNPEAMIIWTPLPTATFTNTTPANFCQGSMVTVPVDVTGQGPWTINYLENGIVKTSQIGTPIFTKTVTTVNLMLNPPLAGANVYSIISVVDGGNCSNNSINSNLIVNVNPLPAVGWTQPDQTICQNGVATLEVLLKGKGPWIVNYTANGVPQSVTLGNPTDMGPIAKQFLVTPSGNTTYCLTSVIDGNLPACTGTFDSRQCLNVKVNPSPTASFLNVNQSICAGTKVKVNVFLRGIGPWTLTYSENGNLVSNPIVLGTAQDQVGGTIRSFDVSPLTTTTYSLVTVTDNTTPTPCTSTVIGSTFTVTVAPQPTANFAIPGPIQTCQGSLTQVPFIVSGKGPWIVRYTITDQVGNIQAKSQIFGNTLSPSPSSFNITENINNNSQICINTVSDGNSCVVNANPNQSCINVLVGQAVSAVLSGQTAVACQGQPVPLLVTFTGGAGPYNISYQIGGEPVIFANGISGPTAVINVVPNGGGSVNVRLLSVALSNGGCTGTAQGSVAVTVQPRPTATITSTGGSVCAGSPFSIGLQLTGKGPWRVYYTRNGVPDSVDLGTGVSGSPFPAIWTPTPTVNTNYALTGVKDANRCLNTASGQISVTVTPTPMAKFTATAPLNSCNGSTTCLEVALQGVGPWNVTVLAGVTPQTFTIGSAGQIGTQTTPVTACINVSPLFPTTYTITNITDSGNGSCPGVVTGNPVTVNVATLPTANITNVGPVPTICLGQSANVIVNLTGAGPFNVTLVNQTTGSTTTVNNASSPVVIPVSPTTAGTNVYTVSSISYSNGSCAVNAPNVNLTGTATVNVLASATAQVTAVNSNICLGGQANAVINFTGIPPYNFAYSINGGTPISNSTSNASFPIAFTANQIGNNTVAVTSISNNSQCPGVVTGNAAVFTVTQGPSAVLSGTVQNVCVGSSVNLTVTLTGVGPFNFTYQEGPNGPTRTVTFATAGANSFTAVPTAVGTRTFTPISITDASGCTNGSVSGQVSANVGTAQNLTVLAVKTDPTCTGGNGSITITAFVTPSCQPGACPLEYSLDGMMWQVSNIFNNVQPGTYTPYSRIINTSCPATGRSVTINPGPVVTSLNITNITVNSANIAWANSAQGPFRVRYRITGGTNWTVIDNITNRNVNLTGLQNNTNYDVEWYSLCGGNLVGPVTATFRTLSGGGCAIVGGVFIDNVAPGTATISWNPVGSAVCYIVQWKPTTSSLWQTASVNAGQNSFTATNLTGACTWEFRIRTNCTSCDPNSGTRSAFTSRFSTTIPNVGCRTDVVASEVSNEAISNFEVYPNPNNGLFSIRFNTAEEGAATITMYDAQGKEVVRREATTVEGQNSIEVDMTTGISTGVYVMKVQKGGSLVTTKVVIN